MVLKLIVFVFCTIFFPANARPEPPYYYPTPVLRQAPTSPTFGVSTSQNFGRTSSSQNYISANFNTAQQNYAIPSTSYGSPILRNTNAGQSVTSSSSTSGIQQGYSGGAQPSRSYGSPDLISTNQAPSRTYVPQPGPINIQKHIYVHAAPEDAEEEPRQRVQQPVSRQKHYKIIFIKTPAYNPPAPYIAQQQALQEEKTLVYVLVKKPEEAPEIAAPQVAPAKLNKPEVYFIKYKARREQNQGGQNIQQQVEDIQDNDSVVIESAGGRSSSSSGQANTYREGYNYDRPVGALD